MRICRPAFSTKILRNSLPGTLLGNRQSVQRALGLRSTNQIPLITEPTFAARLSAAVSGTTNPPKKDRESRLIACTPGTTISRWRKSFPVHVGWEARKRHRQMNFAELSPIFDLGVPIMSL